MPVPRHKFIDTWDLNLSSYTMKLLAGSYQALLFRFSGTNENAATTVPSDFGTIIMRYKGKQKQLVNFNELSFYNLKFGGALEASSDVGGGGGSDAFSYGLILPFHHPDDQENILYVPDDHTVKLEWQPSAGLAAKVTAAGSIVRVIGIERPGLMKYIWGFNRVDIPIVSGNNRPEVINPFNICDFMLEENSNIDSVYLDVDGQSYVSAVETAELSNIDQYYNDIETFVSSGNYLHVDLCPTRRFVDGFNSRVELKLQGSGSDTISCFWSYFDFQLAELGVTQVLDDQHKEQKIASKIATGGSAAVGVNSEVTS